MKMQVMAIFALIVSGAWSLQDPGDFCGTNAYLQRIESHRIRSKVDVSVNFELVRNDLVRLKTDLDEYHRLLEVELQSTKSSKVDYLAPTYVQVDPVPAIAKYSYTKVSGKHSDAYSLCTNQAMALPAAPRNPSELLALTKLMTAHDVVEQPLNVVAVEGVGIRDVVSGQLAQPFTTRYPKTTADTRPVLTLVNSKPKFQNSILTDIVFSFLCAKPQKTHVASLKTLTHFTAAVGKAKSNKRQFDTWQRHVLEFTKQSERALAVQNETDLKLKSPLHLTEVMDLTEELATKENFENIDFPLLAALHEHNVAIVKLFSDLRIISKSSIQIHLSEDELVALAKLIGKPGVTVDGYVVLSRRDEKKCDLEYYDREQEIGMTVYNIWPMLDSEFRLLEDRYLVQDRGGYYTTNSLPVPTNCLLEEDHLHTCSPPMDILAIEQDYECGDYIAAPATSQAEARRSGPARCRKSAVGSDGWHRNALAEQVIIPSVCTKRSDMFTLVNLKKGDIDISCHEMRPRSVHLPIGNFELPQTCKLTRGDRIVRAAGMLSSRYGSNNNNTDKDAALIERFLTDFEIKDKLKSLWTMENFWIAFGSLCATTASVLAVVCLLCCCKIKNELIHATSVAVETPAARGRQAANVYNPYASHTVSEIREDKIKDLEKKINGSRRMSNPFSEYNPRSTAVSRTGSVLMITDLNPGIAL